MQNFNVETMVMSNFQDKLILTFLWLSCCAWISTTLYFLMDIP